MDTIRKYRKAKGLTQLQLAKTIGVKKSTVAMWEIGARKPDIVKLKKLSAIFGCTTDQLLEPIEI